MAERPPHIISPEEVDAWLVDSVVKTVTWHSTNPDAAGSIVEHGVRMDLAEPESTWGQGFYSTNRPRARYGRVSIPVAVRLTQPLIVDSIGGLRVVDSLLAQHGTDDIRAAVIAAQFDGVVVDFGDGERWVVAFFAEQVRIVQEH